MADDDYEARLLRDFRLNFEQQQKRAKELLKTARAGDPVATARFKGHGSSSSTLPIFPAPGASAGWQSCRPKRCACYGRPGNPSAKCSCSWASRLGVH